MIKLIITDLKMMVRNRQSLFWALMFPVMFTVIFGLFFGRENNVSGTISIINESDTELAKGLELGLREAKLFTIRDEPDLDKAKELIVKNKISAIVYIPENFGQPTPDSPKSTIVYFDPGSVQVSTIVSSYLGQYLTQTNYAIQNAQPIYSVLTEKTGSNKPFTYFSFVLAGILGLALMNGSIIGIAVGISKYKQDKILKRLMTTPLPTWKFLGAEVLSRLVLNVVQIGLILTIGIYGFSAQFNGSILLLVLVALMGGLLFQLIGFVIASIAKNEDAAQGMSQAITIPMMFLAGVFFPIDALPDWLSKIVQFLPLAPFLRIMRNIAIEDLSPFYQPINIAIVIGWIILALFVAVWRFRMSEE